MRDGALPTPPDHRARGDLVARDVVAGAGLVGDLGEPADTQAFQQLADDLLRLVGDQPGPTHSGKVVLLRRQRANPPPAGQEVVRALVAVASGPRVGGDGLFEPPVWVDRPLFVEPLVGLVAQRCLLVGIQPRGVDREVHHL